MPYTGCNPRGLVLARGKDLSKKLLTYHRIPTAGIRRVPDAAQDQAPAAARPAAHRQEPERGCVLRDRAGVGGRHRREARRARDLHPRADRHRGHRRAVHRGPRALCRRARQRAAARAADLGARFRQPWRKATGRSPPSGSSTTSSTRSAAASMSGRQRTSRRSSPPRIQRVAKRIYRTLELDGYARIDFRLSADGMPYFIEANPNPEIAQHRGVRLGRAARRAGISRPAEPDPGAGHQPGITGGTRLVVFFTVRTSRSSRRPYVEVVTCFGRRGLLGNFSLLVTRCRSCREAPLFAAVDSAGHACLRWQCHRSRARGGN